MFCPQCQSEYREGCTRCADCDVALVQDVAVNEEQSVPSSEGSPLQRPLLWVLSLVLFCLLFLIPALDHSPRRITYFLFFLRIRYIATLGWLFGTCWMLYQSLNYERRKGYYAALSVIPYMFVWYFSERYFVQTSTEPAESVATNTVAARNEPDLTAAMFCPLCKAGFREGFKICSDCHLPLLDSQQRAQDCPVSRLWRAKDREKFEAYLTILQNAGIAYRFKEHIKGQPTFQIQILGFSFFPNRDTLWNEYEIFVLQKDFSRANVAIHSAS